MVDRGYREVVLTGIHLGHYGVDWNRNSPKRDWVRLSHLVRRIAELPGDFRVRLSSIEATEVTRELVDVMADSGDRVAPHLHISMQSGSDTVLRRMRRRWGAQRFIDRCRLLQERLDQPAITTDIIVGFPGETDREFQETIDAARAVGFSKIHIFPFSPRRGTPAADMPNHVPKHLQQERSRELAVVEAQLREDYYRSLIGRHLRSPRGNASGKRLDRNIMPLCHSRATCQQGRRGAICRCHGRRRLRRTHHRPLIQPVVPPHYDRYNPGVSESAALSAAPRRSLSSWRD